MSSSLEEFFSTCTVHGLLQIQRSRVRIWWIVFVFMALIGTVVHLSVLSIKYVDSPINSQIFPYDTDFEFPDITLCPVYTYSNFRVNKLRNFKNEPNKAMTILRRFWKVSVEKGHLSELTNEEIEQFVAYSMMPWIFAKNISIIKDEVIMQSQFGSKYYGISDYENIYNAQSGFNCVLISHRNASNVLSSLYLDLAAKFRPSPYIHESVVFRMYIHPPGSYPFDHTSPSIDIYVGNQHIITLDIRGFRSIEVKNKPCSFRDDLITVLNNFGATEQFHYSSYLCRAEGIQKQMIEKCSCFSEFYAAVIPSKDATKYPFCHTVESSLVDKLLHQNSSAVNSSIDAIADPTKSLTIQRAVCHEKVMGSFRKDGWFKTSNSECLSKCNARQYLTKVSFLRMNEQQKDNEQSQKIIEAWKSHLTKGLAKTSIWTDNDLKDLVSIKRLFRAQVSVSPYSSKGSLVRQELNLSISSVFGMMGSIIGMWMGMSLISLVEVAEFILSIVHARRMKNMDGTQFNLPLKAT